MSALLDDRLIYIFLAGVTGWVVTTVLVYVVYRVMMRWYDGGSWVIDENIRRINRLTYMSVVIGVIAALMVLALFNLDVVSNLLGL